MLQLQFSRLLTRPLEPEARVVSALLPFFLSWGSRKLAWPRRSGTLLPTLRRDAAPRTHILPPTQSLTPTPPVSGTGGQRQYPGKRQEGDPAPRLPQPVLPARFWSGRGSAAPRGEIGSGYRDTRAGETPGSRDGVVPFVGWLGSPASASSSALLMPSSASSPPPLSSPLREIFQPHFSPEIKKKKNK